MEALERFDLFSRFVPEWRHVRSLPQRNAFHTYTVDRHLLQTVANANEYVRQVQRPDLLLAGALFHDIGKGHPGDHTEVGMQLVVTIGERMGYSAEDIAVRVKLVQHHLLLPETATRRDLSDPRTWANVADAVGNLQVLELTQGFAYAPLQREAIRKAMTENCLVLTGGPGNDTFFMIRDPDGNLAEARRLSLPNQSRPLHRTIA